MRIHAINPTNRFIIFIATAFLFLVVGISTLWGKNNPVKGLATVVIDPGHGGKDPGAIVGKAREKDIVLDIALKVGAGIKEKFPDVKVIYTRSTDVFVPLYERSVIANKNNAQLFISIHANYCTTPSIKGTETYVLGLHRTEDNLNVAKKENSVILLEKDYSTRYEGFDPNLSESYIMFELIQDTHLEQSLAFAGILQQTFLNHAQRSNRDVRQAGFLVLRETAMPAVLIETGYISNPSENQYLLTSDGRSTLANSIVRSFGSYKFKFESRTSGNEEISDKQTGSVEEESHPAKEISPSATEEHKIQKIDTGKVKPKERIDEKSGREPQQERSITKTPRSTAVAEKGREVVRSRASKPSSPNEKKSEIEEKTGKITFAIQLAASPKKLSPSLKIFRGIDDIKILKIDGYYKYYCRKTTSYQKAKKYLMDLKSQVPDAFIAAFLDDEPISIKEALKNR